MTRPGIEPRYPGPLANILPIMPMYGQILKQNLEVESHKTGTVQPFTSRLTYHLSKTLFAILEKKGQNHKRRSPMDS